MAMPHQPNHCRVFHGRTDRPPFASHRIASHGVVAVDCLMVA